MNINRRISIIFSVSELRHRPYVIDFESGINAAILGIYYGWIDGINDLKNTPRIAYERHGTLGGIAGTLIAVANSILKPLVGTLSTMTWLCRGLYASINNPILNTNSTFEFNSSSDIIIDNEQEHDKENISEVAKITGYQREQCKRILFEFDKIKKQRVNIYSHEHQL